MTIFLISASGSIDEKNDGEKYLHHYMPLHMKGRATAEQLCALQNHRRVTAF